MERHEEIMDDKKLSTMKYKVLKVIIILGVLILLSGCRNRGGNTGIHVAHSPSWGVKSEASSACYIPEEKAVEPELLDYKSKASFTSLAYMEDLIPPGSQDYELGTVNAKFIKGCYYTGSTSIPFLSSFAERWNSTTFFRRFINAAELFERMNTNVGDSLTTETIRGKMPMLPGEIELAFKDSKSRSLARKLTKMLSTIDYVPEQTEKMAELYQELISIPCSTPELLPEEEIERLQGEFWQLYDKEKYVNDITAIQAIRRNDETPANDLTILGNKLKHRYIEESDFDVRCILALEIGCCGDPDAIDYLGELIEDGRYSKYLLEVWLSWRLLAQSEVFGISTFSEIPDNLYDNARLLVAKSFLRHIDEQPNDNLAKLLLLNLTFAENIHRAGGYYGNEALGAHLYLRNGLFLPDSSSE